MTGKHRIIIETERIKYDFTIKRNITVILGNSATGKTTLVDLLNLYVNRGNGSGISLQSDAPCVVYSGSWDRWRDILGSVQSSIVFIDEDYPFIFSQDFAELVKESDNYYVLITRRPLHNLPYSTQEIYGIRTSGKFLFPEKVYQEFYPIYPVESDNDKGEEHVLLLEDTGAGLEFFQKSLKNVECYSAGGNSRISSKLAQMDMNKRIIVIADGAAFGAYIESLLSIASISNNVGLYLPESFEWMILKSGIIKSVEIEKILANPEDYIESSVYFSWERFFTELLENVTKDDTKLNYHKDKISGAYLNEHNKKAILNVLPDKIKDYLYLE